MTQSWTDDVYASSHVAATDLQNIENNFACLKSCFSGSSAPSNPVAGMLWLDTANHLIKVRNEANNAWLTAFNLTSVACPLALSVPNGAIGANQLADGGVTLAKLAPYNAGAYQLIESGGVVGLSLARIIQFTLDRGGTLRIGMTLAVADGSTTVYGRIYRNGSPVGTQRTYTGSSSASWTEDIAGWSAGDKVQLYGYALSTAGTPTGSLALSCGNWPALRVSTD